MYLRGVLAQHFGGAHASTSALILQLVNKTRIISPLLTRWHLKTSGKCTRGSDLFSNSRAAIAEVRINPRRVPGVGFYPGAVGLGPALSPIFQLIFGKNFPTNFS